jgi:hypothetical protein
MPPNTPGVCGAEPTGANADELRNALELRRNQFGVIESNNALNDFIIRRRRDRLGERGVEIEVGKLAIRHERPMESAELRPGLHVQLHSDGSRVVAATIASKSCNYFSNNNAFVPAVADAMTV